MGKVIIFTISIVLFFAYLVPVRGGSVNAQEVEEPCFYKDEMISDIFISMFLMLGAKSAKCDALLSTDEYTNLNAVVVMNHQKMMTEVSKPLKVMMARNDIEPKDYMTLKMSEISTVVEKQVMTETDCKNHFDEMSYIKDNWGAIAGLAAGVMAFGGDKKYRACEVTKDRN